MNYVLCFNNFFSISYWFKWTFHSLPSEMHIRPWRFMIIFSNVKGDEDTNDAARSSSVLKHCSINRRIVSAISLDPVTSQLIRMNMNEILYSFIHTCFFSKVVQWIWCESVYDMMLHSITYHTWHNMISHK